MAVKHSVGQWADALGIDRRSLVLKLVKAGIDAPKSVPAKSIFDAIVGEKPNDRLATAKAVETERENDLASGQLHTRADIERVVWEELLSPIRNMLLGFKQSTGDKIKTVMQSRGVSDSIAAEAAEIASAGVLEIMEKIRQ